MSTDYDGFWRTPWRKDYQPTHRHVKTGGLYRELHRGFLEKDLTPVVIYQSSDGRVWVRPEAEFDDGRFEKFEATPPRRP